MQNRRKQIFIWFLILLLCVFFLPFRYESNDDIFLELTYSGFFTGSFETGSLFSHYWVGEFLSILYPFTKGLNIFSCLNIIILLFSCVLLIRLAIDNQIQTNAFVFSSIIAGAFCISIIHLNYSSVAFWAGFSGLLNLFSKHNNKKTTIQTIAFVLIFIAICIRSNFFILAVLLSLPVIIKYFIEFKSETVKLLFILIALFGSLHYINSYHFENNKLWSRNYSEYKIEKDIIDNPNFNNYYLKPHLGKLNWTENDLKMYRDFYFDYPKSIPIKELQYIKNVLPFDSMDFVELIPSLIRQIPWYIWSLLLYSWTFSWAYGGKRHLFYQIVFFISILLFLKYLSGNKFILKDRLLIPIFLGLSLNCFLYLKRQFLRTKLTRMAFIIPGTILFLNIVYNVRLINKNDIDYKTIETSVAQKKGEYIFFDYYLSYPYSEFRNWESSSNQLKGIRFIPTGWIMNTPVGGLYLNKLGFNSLNQAVSDKNTLHLVPFYNLETYKSTLQLYYLEKFKQKIYFEIVEEIKSPGKHWLLLKMTSGQ